MHNLHGASDAQSPRERFICLGQGLLPLSLTAGLFTANVPTPKLGSAVVVTCTSLGWLLMSC